MLELKRWRLQSPWSEDNDVVFPNAVGRPIDETAWLRTVWHPARRSAGLRHLTPHSLRHFSGSFLLDQGEGMGYVMDHLGHSGIELTMGTYRHKLKVQNQGAARRF